MSTSEKTLEQVKSILGRLDRSIDAAREKRLNGSATPAPGAAPAPQAFRDSNQQQIGAEGTPPPPTSSSSTTSKFGRAQPLRLEDRPRF